MAKLLLKGETTKGQNGPILKKVYLRIVVQKKKINFDLFNSKAHSGVASKNATLKKSIIKKIDRKSHCTITELSKELNTSVPKTTTLITSLVENGFIQDEGKLDSTGGRKASVFGLAPDACHFIGVSVSRFHIDFGVMNFKKGMNTPVHQVNYKFENTAEALNQLIEEIDKFLKGLENENLNVKGIGIAMPGRTNTKIGKTLSYFNFTDEPLKDILQRAFKIPVFIENDSRAMVFAEMNVGDSINEKNLVFVNIDYGIGIGIIIDGKTYYGKSGYSGELGHIPLFDNEIICICGKKGCFETEASGFALKRKFKDKLKSGSSSSVLKHKKIEDIQLSDIVYAANQEDMLAIELLAEVGEKFGKGLAVLINIFNPETLIIGGALAETGDYIRLPARSVLNKFSSALVNNDTTLRLSKLGEHAGVIGACLIARSRVIF
ncbi:MAG: ROK family transcriptional regulator [Chitinophagaceae bacterium]